MQGKEQRPEERGLIHLVTDLGSQVVLPVGVGTDPILRRSAAEVQRVRVHVLAIVAACFALETSIFGVAFEACKELSNWFAPPGAQSTRK